MIAFLTKMIFDPKPRPRPDIPPLPERCDPYDNSYTYEDEYGQVHWSTSDEDEE